MSECGCFPEAAELARLAENAQAGRAEAFVGTGDPDTVLHCPHGGRRLGDAMAPPPRVCSETTKAGDPCKGTPGEDGLCAAHKPKGDDGAGPADADQAGGQVGQGEEAQGQEEEGGHAGGAEAQGEGPGA